MATNIQWKSMVPKTVWLQTFFKISSFVSSRRKKLILVIIQLEGE